MAKRVSFAGRNHRFYAGASKIESACGLGAAFSEANFESVTSRGKGLRVEKMRGWGGVEFVAVFAGTVDDFHEAFSGKDEFVYLQLERRHDYIQWLFPSPDASAFNAESDSLSGEEVAAMAKDSTVMERMHTSFRMILDFWGFELVAPSRRTQPRPRAARAAAAAGGPSLVPRTGRPQQQRAGTHRRGLWYGGRLFRAAVNG